MPVTTRFLSSIPPPHAQAKTAGHPIPSPCRLAKSGRQGHRVFAADLVARAHRALDVAGELAAFLDHHLAVARSEEHTSELQSLMRIPYAVFRLKKKNTLTYYSYNIQSH